MAVLITLNLNYIVNNKVRTVFQTFYKPIPILLQMCKQFSRHISYRLHHQTSLQHCINVLSTACQATLNCQIYPVDFLPNSLHH
jgi:hypothetical protein